MIHSIKIEDPPTSKATPSDSLNAEMVKSSEDLPPIENGICLSSIETEDKQPEKAPGRVRSISASAISTVPKNRKTVQTTLVPGLKPKLFGVSNNKGLDLKFPISEKQLNSSQSIPKATENEDYAVSEEVRFDLYKV